MKSSLLKVNFIQKEVGIYMCLDLVLTTVQHSLVIVHFKCATLFESMFVNMLRLEQTKGNSNKTARFFTYHLNAISLSIQYLHTTTPVVSDELG